jgi:hypothetical protein
VDFGVAWRDPAAYLAVTGAQWAIAIVSLVIWLWLLFRLSRLEPRTRLLWQLYTSFGVLLAFGLVADFAKFLNSNLQLRMFTPFTLFSSALVAYGTKQAWLWLRKAHRPRLRRVLLLTASLLMVFAFLAAQLKITNDPAIANQWLFYSPAEVRAGKWVDAHIENQNIWVDTSSRLQVSLYFQQGYMVKMPNNFFSIMDSTSPPYLLISKLSRLRANRAEINMPSTLNYLEIYDNGIVQIFHRRPLTPFQR